MYEDKAKAVERKLLRGLNEEQSWAAKHPAAMTVITLVLFVGLIAALVRGCH